ncbi:DUF2325 domain-containing protein_gp025 [Bacillus phage vB_BceM_WH1]|nr:DUF2325 domain-containing protein_gp025 [Bacillus phage vB_BceM_WH1]
MQKQLLENIKQGMTKEIERLDFTNHELIHTKLEEYLAAVRSISKVPQIFNNLEVTEVKEVKPAIKKVEEVKKEETARAMYRFEKRIKGGNLPEKDAFVPEKKIRELDLQTGDMLYAEKIETEPGYTGPIQYEYTLAQRRDKEYPENRVQIEKCIVKLDESISRFYVDKDINGNEVSLPDVPGAIYLPESDTDDMKMQVDDVVDIAYDINNPNYLRVVWRYNISDVYTSAPTQSQLMLGARIKTDKTKKVYEATLDGKLVLMVGYEPGKPQIREEVERRKGIFEWAEGREEDKRLYSMIARADAVIFMLEFMKHAGSIKGVDYCKRLGVPFDTMHNFGRTEFINKTEALLRLDENATA